MTALAIVVLPFSEPGRGPEWWAGWMSWVDLGGAVVSERGFLGPAGHGPRVLGRAALGAALGSAAALRGTAALLAAPRALAAASLGGSRLALAGPRVVA